MRKRSISIQGHRTSIMLEPEFWTVLDGMAQRRGVSLPALIAEIDQRRMATNPPPGLASALRVFALREAAASGAGDKAD